MQSVYPSTTTPVSDETIWWRAWSRPNRALLLSNNAVVGELIYFAPSPESVLPPKAMILPVTSAIVNIRRLTNLSESDEPAPTTRPAAKSNLSGIFFCLAADSKSLSAPRARPICQLLTLSSESCLFRRRIFARLFLFRDARDWPRSIWLPRRWREQSHSGPLRPLSLVS